MKIIIYLLMICILSITVLAYDNNEVIDLYKIDTCSGLVSVRVHSENVMSDGELLIEGLTKENNIWSGNCNNNFMIRLKTPITTNNKYDFLIQYYTDYKEIPYSNSSIPSNDEVYNEEHKIEKKINDVFIGDKEKKKFAFSFNIETKNAVIVGVLVCIFIIIIVYFKIITPNMNHNKNYDVLNYSNKETEKDEDAEKILDMLK